MCAAYGVVFAVFGVIAAPMITLIVGDEFEGSVTIVRWLAPLVLLRSLAIFPLNGLMGLGYTRLRTDPARRRCGAEPHALHRAGAELGSGRARRSARSWVRRPWRSCRGVALVKLEGKHDRAKTTVQRPSVVTSAPEPAASGAH